MGLPQINIAFKKQAATVINRSGRGMVVILLQDTTGQQDITPYMGFDEVARSDWTEKNYEYLKMVFRAAPTRVVAVRAVMEEESMSAPATLQLVKDISFDYLVSPYFNTEHGETVKSYIKKLREAGKKAKAVLPNFAADCEGCINVAVSDIGVVWEEGSEVVTYSTAEYCCRIAGVLAALPLTQSATYYELPEIVSAAPVEDPDAEIDAGKLVVIYDGEKFKIGRGVTSLVTTDEEHPEDFKKIKIVEASDIIRFDIKSTFEDNFVGKCNCSYDNKQQFVGAVNQYLTDLENTVINSEEPHYVAISIAANLDYLKKQGRDTDEMGEQQILEADTGSNLYLAGQLKLLDAMEDLDITMQL